MTVTVCHSSNWNEVDRLEDTLFLTVIEKKKAHFARSTTLITDQSLSVRTTGSSLLNTGLNIPRHPPYHPKGNGRAEAAVKVAESMLKKADDFHSAMLTYRNTRLKVTPTHQPSTCFYDAPEPHTNHRSSLDPHNTKL